MTDQPDRTPSPPDPGRPGASVSRPSGPRPLFSDEPTGHGGEDPTQVHRTGGVPAQDPGVTGFAPAAPVAPTAPGATGPRPAAAAAPAPAGDPAVAAVAEPRKVSIRNRGRMRRRLGYLRRVRELGYRDLGGLVFELRRAGVENEVLVGAKVDALHAIDHELHVLEHAMRDHRSVEELYEPGVSVCLRCGALHGSDANFCPQCGIRVDRHGAAPAPSTPAGTPAGPATVVTAPTGGATGAIPAPGQPPAPGAEPGPGREQATGAEHR